VNDPLVVSVLVVGVWTLGLTGLRSMLIAYSVQTVLLGILAIRHAHDGTMLLAGCAFLILKGVAIPGYLAYVVRRTGSRHDVGLVIAPPFLMLFALGGLALMMTVLSAEAMPAVGLLVVSLLLMLSRRLPISQIVGFLMLENGAFLFAVVQPQPMPVLIEMGVLLDILVWTMLAGVLSIDVSQA